ncbi:DUF2726 domain-containing protein [Oscillochloris sp. ZM17-4]|nr:DUF2726 domain-containing protein [Oscillochloris sp. ZM17-4]
MTTPFISSLIGAALCLSALLLGAYVTLQARRRRARPTQSRANDYDAVPVPTRRAGEGPLFAHPPTHPDAAPQVASSTPAPAALPYTRKHSLLTQAERDFFAVLQEAAPPGWHIFPQVRLNGLLVIRAPERSRMWWAHFNWVSAKSVDFVLCDGADISPQLVVELDDSSHRRPDRQERDAFVDAALASAGLRRTRSVRVTVRVSLRVRNQTPASVNWSKRAKFRKPRSKMTSIPRSSPARMRSQKRWSWAWASSSYQT